MKDYRSVTWEDLNKINHISPIEGLDAVTIHQSAEWCGVQAKDLTPYKQKCKKDLDSLGMFTDTGRKIMNKLHVQYHPGDAAPYYAPLADGTKTEIRLSKISYFPAPALARLATEVGIELDLKDLEDVGDQIGVACDQQMDVKSIQFMGSELIAARDADGQIWAGVRWICEGIGLSEDQIKHERKRIQKDRAFCGSVSNLTLNKSGYGNRKVLCLKLNFVPLWLAKINITPAMERETPEVATKLTQYKMRLADTLADKFAEQNKMEVKKVPFMGSELIAARDGEGQTWAGVSYICNGIGFSKSQKDTQIQRIQKDNVLLRGCLKFQAGIFDDYNETIALRLDYVPLWLAKINITPAMERETPELADRLLQYQLRAKDVLADAFLPKETRYPKFDIPKNYSGALRVAADLWDENQKLGEKVSALEGHVSDLQIVNHALAQQELTWNHRGIVNCCVRMYTAKTYPNKNDKTYFGVGWTDFYKELLYRKHICLSKRTGGNTNLDRVKDEEWPEVSAVAIAMCEESGIDVSDVVRKYQYCGSCVK